MTPDGTQLLDTDTAPVVDYCEIVGSEGTSYNMYNIHPSATTVRSAIAQSFTGNGGNLYTIGVKVKKVGSPTFTLTAYLYAHSGTFGTSSVPTGAVLKTSTNTFSESDISSDIQDWIFFTFDGAYTLTAATKYVLVIAITAGSGLSSSAYVAVSCYTGFGHNGNTASFQSSAWAARATYDCKFIVLSATRVPGDSQAVTMTPNTVGGFVLPTTLPFEYDGVDLGTVNSAGTEASYTCKEQITPSVHALVSRAIYGWGVVATGTTADGYKGVNAGSGSGFTRSGSNTQWYLDGGWVYTGTSYTVPAQTPGTYHTIECTT